MCSARKETLHEKVTGNAHDLGFFTVSEVHASVHSSPKVKVVGGGGGR